MTEEEKQMLLATMYDEETKEKRPLRVDHEAAMNKKVRRIAVGIIGYDVPTPEYVDSLERRLIKQEQTIIEQARAIKRLDVLLNALRNVVTRQGRSVTEVSRELDNKISRREP